MAFRSLLSKKRYDHITVQDIIDAADVGRSTFYAHFETKDMLLDAMCQDMFYHIFDKAPCPLAKGSSDIEAELAHLLRHIKNGENDLAKIIRSDSNDLFMFYFKKHLRGVFESHADAFRIDIPKEFLLNLLVGSFSEMIRWWVQNGMKTAPDTCAEYFMKIIEKH